MMSSPGGKRWCSAFVALVPLMLLTVGCTLYGATLDRQGDPIVLTGAQLPKLLGSAPDQLVGFVWNTKGEWVQVPVQVDERDWVSPGQILHEPVADWPTVSGSLYKILVYTPTSWTGPGYTSLDTYTPHDSDPTFDANDELSLLVDDTGVRAPAGTTPPSGVDASRGQEVEITDPLDSSRSGWVYLYPSTVFTGGSAGTTGVHYTFSLDSGSYQATYHMGLGALAPNDQAAPNPEHSSVVTAFYSQTFADRWLNEGVGITDGGSPGTAMLERSRVQLGSPGCTGTEDTFDGAVPTVPYEGAFIVNISGPVRAIRSQLGANSGAYTVATDYFYPKNEQSRYEMRGPSISSLSLTDDFLTGTPGLSYSDDQNSAGAHRRHTRRGQRIACPGLADGFRPARLAHHLVGDQQRHLRLVHLDLRARPVPGHTRPLHRGRVGLGPERHHADRTFRRSPSLHRPRGLHRGLQPHADPLPLLRGSPVLERQGDHPRAAVGGAAPGDDRLNPATRAQRMLWRISARSSTVVRGLTMQKRSTVSPCHVDGTVRVSPSARARSLQAR